MKHERITIQFLYTAPGGGDEKYGITDKELEEKRREVVNKSLTTGTHTAEGEKVKPKDKFRYIEEEG